MLKLHLIERQKTKEQWKAIAARQKENGNVEIKIILC